MKMTFIFDLRIGIEIMKMTYRVLFHVSEIL